MTNTSLTQTNIPALLAERGHSLRWFCGQIGMHRSYVWMMENGHRPVSQDYLERAAKVLHIPVALLSTESSIMEHDNSEREPAHAA